MCGVAAGLSRPSKHLIRLAFIMRSSPHNVGHHESRFPSLGIRPLVRWARLMSESGRICLPAYEPVPSNYAWRLQSIGAIALSIEVPFVFGRQNPRELCVHEVLFQGAITPSVANITASVSMSAITSKADIHWHNPHVRFVPIASSVRRAMTLANMRQNGVRTLGVTLAPAWDAR
jgi:hypothetical protein